MKKFLVSSTSSDSHTWNLVFLELLLEERGHEAVNIGNCVPVEVLVERCLAERPDYVVLSSVNGHGLRDGLAAARAIRACEELADLPLIVGGKLNTRGADEAAMERSLRDAGFDHVFQGDDSVARFCSLLSRIESMDEVAGMALPLAQASFAPALA